MVGRCASESCNLCSVGTRASVFDVALGADDKVVEGKTVKGLDGVHHAVRAIVECLDAWHSASSASTLGMHASSEIILPLPARRAAASRCLIHWISNRARLSTPFAWVPERSKLSSPSQQP